jgi:hypothetical protein
MFTTSRFSNARHCCRNAGLGTEKPCLPCSCSHSLPSSQQRDISFSKMTVFAVTERKKGEGTTAVQVEGFGIEDTAQGE